MHVPFRSLEEVVPSPNSPIDATGMLAFARSQVDFPPECEEAIQRMYECLDAREEIRRHAEEEEQQQANGNREARHADSVACANADFGVVEAGTGHVVDSDDVLMMMKKVNRVLQQRHE